MGPTTFVIVGGGLAGANAAGQLRKEGFEGRIVLVGEEPVRPYERPPLSKGYLRGETERERLNVHGPTFYDENSIELWTSSRAAAIEPHDRAVVLEDGRRLGYDRLVIATGARPRRLPVPGSDLPGVHYLRTAEDSDRIREAGRSARRAIVIGGGWIAAEVAASLRQGGLPVVLIGNRSTPLERILGPELGTIYRDLHAEHGTELRMGQRVVAVHGADVVEAVETSDGSRVEGDLVVAGIGVEPRTELAVTAGLAVRDGVVVDERLEASVPGIFAIGDVASAWHPVLRSRIRSEHWDNARRQGRAVARNLLGAGEPYSRIPYFFSDQFDLGMEYAGFAPRWDEVVFRGDPAGREFIAFWLREGRVAAGLNANVWKVNDAIQRLVASRERVAVERLTDPSVDLGDLDALVARDST